MNIYPIDNSVSMQGKIKKPNWFKRQLRRVEQKILDAIPNRTSEENPNSKKYWDKTSQFIGHPMWNRGIMGVTALFTQPAIDYYNHRVDDETRTVSRNRTVAKIIAGTLVGMFVVRGPVYKVIEKMTNINGTKKYSKWLLPKQYINTLKEHPNMLQNYKSSVSMAIALGLMCITNFVLDAPLTVFLTNYFNKKSNVELASNPKPSKKEVNDG